MLKYFRCHRDKKNGKNTGALDILQGRLLIKKKTSNDNAKMAEHTTMFLCERKKRKKLNPNNVFLRDEGLMNEQ